MLHTRKKPELLGNNTYHPQMKAHIHKISRTESYLSTQLLRVQWQWSYGHNFLKFVNFTHKETCKSKWNKIRKVVSYISAVFTALIWRSLRLAVCLNWNLLSSDARSLLKQEWALFVPTRLRLSLNCSYLFMSIILSLSRKISFKI